jgi:hypothetical protein
MTNNSLHDNSYTSGLSPYRQQALKSLQLSGTLEDIKNRFLAFHSQSLQRIRQLEERNKELVQINQQLQESIPGQLLKLQNTTLEQRQKIQSLESDIETRDHRINELLNLIEQQKIQMESLESKLRDQTKLVIAKYEELIATSKSHIQTVALKDKIIEDLNAKNAILSKQLEDTQRACNDEIAQLKSRLIKAQNQHIALHAEFDLARKVYEDRIINLEKELQDTLHRFESERPDLSINKFIEREKYDELVTECRTLQEKVNELMNLNAIAVSENNNLISQVAFLKQQLTSLTESNSKLHSETTLLKEQLTDERRKSQLWRPSAAQSFASPPDESHNISLSSSPSTKHPSNDSVAPHAAQSSEHPLNALIVTPLPNNTPNDNSSQNEIHSHSSPSSRPPHSQSLDLPPKVFDSTIENNNSNAEDNDKNKSKSVELEEKTKRNDTNASSPRVSVHTEVVPASGGISKDTLRRENEVDVSTSPSSTQLNSPQPPALSSTRERKKSNVDTLRLAREQLTFDLERINSLQLKTNSETETQRETKLRENDTKSHSQTSLPSEKRTVSSSFISTKSPSRLQRVVSSLPVVVIFLLVTFALTVVIFYHISFPFPIEFFSFRQ